MSVFWSRSLLFPDPMRPSEALAEGIVPGLDFCNHGGARANATWAVEVQPRSRGAVVDAQEAPRHEFVIRDTPWRSRGVGAGTEVVINYGDGRSSEEMLFCYGFCSEPQNAADALLVTPLLGADGEVYAVAQGAVSTGAIAARGAGASVTRGVPTAARIASGAIIEREITYQLNARDQMRLALRNPDLTTARRIAAVINRTLGGNSAAATDPRTVVLAMQGRDPVSVLGAIDQLRVEPDQTAKVIIEEASGTIVMGANVRVSTVAIAQGNLTIRVTETPQVSQPNALAQGQTVVTPRTNIEIDDQADRKVGMLRGGVTLQDLVRGLNSLGVGPRDLISILQTIKAAGALQAELELR